MRIRAATRVVLDVVGRSSGVLAVLAVAAGPALAHSGHASHASGGSNVALPAALVAGGLLVVGTSVYLDRRGELDGRLKDLGVLVGVVGLLAGVTLGLI